MEFVSYRGGMRAVRMFVDVSVESLELRLGRGWCGGLLGGLHY